ncbi:MAG: ankyrin repeat domain-containing protein [Blastocatellia bacterium]|nr:ankyrin repeat domain-containing protein [Blastocatellia bacterium]
MLKKIHVLVALVMLLGGTGTALAQNDEQLKKELFEAAKAGNAAKLKESLDKGANFTAKDEKTGKTALHYAVSSGNADSIKLMIDAFRSFNIDKAAYQQMKPEEQAGWVNSVKDFLVDADGNTPVVEAIQSGNPEALRLILTAGFMLPALVNLPAKNSSNALLEAAKKGDLPLVQLLLENGADIKSTDSLGQTALHLATPLGRLELVKLLLDKGADANAKTKSGWTVLLGIAEMGPSPELVQLLLDRGANVNEVGPQGCTALLQNLRSGRQTIPVLKLLLDKGANINAADIGGTTALHRAAFHQGAEAVVQFLLDRNADPNLKNNDGKTALQIALSRGNNQSAEFLKAKGAQ